MRCVGRSDLPRFLRFAGSVGGLPRWVAMVGCRERRGARPTQNGDFGMPRNRLIDRLAAVAMNRFGFRPNHTYMNGAGSTPVLMVAMDCGLPESRPDPPGPTR